jgi:hypothetical protein
MRVRPLVYPFKALFSVLLLDRLLALLANFKLGWKGLPGTNTVAFYYLYNYGREKFFNFDT